MTTSVEIVIRGRDEFSPAFAALDNALRDVSANGDSAGKSLSQVGEAMNQLAGYTADVGRDSAALTQQFSENLVAVEEAHGEALTSVAENQETWAAELGNQLLDIDAQFYESRESQLDGSLARQREAYAAHFQAMEADAAASMRLMEVAEEKHLLYRLQRYQTFFVRLSELAASQNRSMANLHKTLAIAEALFSAYQAANAALAQVPYPLNLAASALVLAEGLANAERIRRTNVAHGGLEQVPEDSTFLLRRGERVLAPNQNRDLTSFLRTDRDSTPGRGVVIQNLTIHLFENATNADALLSMESDQLRQVVADKIIPALDQLSRMGIQPQFSTENT